MHGNFHAQSNLPYFRLETCNVNANRWPTSFILHSKFGPLLCPMQLKWLADDEAHGSHHQLQSQRLVSPHWWPPAVSRTFHRAHPSGRNQNISGDFNPHRYNRCQSWLGFYSSHQPRARKQLPWGLIHIDIQTPVVSRIFHRAHPSGRSPFHRSVDTEGSISFIRICRIKTLQSYEFAKFRMFREYWNQLPGTLSSHRHMGRYNLPWTGPSFSDSYSVAGLCAARVQVSDPIQFIKTINSIRNSNLPTKFRRGFKHGWGSPHSIQRQSQSAAKTTVN